MDRMAYLQQISNDKYRPGPVKTNPRNDILSKILTVRNGIILGALVILIIIIIILANSFKTVKDRDKDFLLESYFHAKFLDEITTNTYQEKIKSSDLRSITSSLKSILKEITRDNSALLSSVHSLEIDSITEEDKVQVDQKTENTALNEILYNAHISGRLDRIYVREMSLQIAKLIFSESNARESSDKNSIKVSSDNEIKNLQNIKDQLDNLSTKAL